MNRSSCSAWVLMILIGWCAPGLAAEDGDQAPAEDPTGNKAASWLMEHAKLEALWYLHYGWGEEEDVPFNAFRVSRGYTTIKFKLTDWFRVRSTVDLYEDDDGWELRFKYLYGRFVLPIETAVISYPMLEFGLVHGPWLSYEESINRYRLQGTMFLERNHLFNSADLGLTVGALLGEKLPDDYCQEVNCHFPGTWGSISAGVYNGGGYHGGEFNQNKVLMARLSVRPAGPWLPNLSLSYMTIYGAGAEASEPDWNQHAGMISFEHAYLVLTAQAAMGAGNQNGTRVDADGDAQPFTGFSGFAEIKLPWIWSALFGRYDWFRWETDSGNVTSGRIIAGAAFYFYKDCAVVFDYDRIAYAEDGVPADWEAKLTLQVYLH